MRSKGVVRWTAIMCGRYVLPKNVHYPWRFGPRCVRPHGHNGPHQPNKHGLERIKRIKNMGLG